MDVVEITDNPSDEDISLSVSPQPNRDTALNSDNNSNYYLVCNYCNNGVRFNQFERFLQHVKTEHQKVSVSDPQIDVNAVGIKCDTIVISDTEEKNVPPNTSSQNPDTSKDAKIALDKLYYDLRTLSRPALFDIIDVLGQCACLWHEPTRQRSTHRDRFCAHYLLLTKLRQHQKQATLPEVRNIVRQLVKNFQIALEPCSGDQNELETITDEPQPTTSYTVLERLMFLASDKESDMKEVNISKLCNFCNKGFCTYEGLWAHMKSDHVVLQTYPPTANEKAEVDEVEDEQNKEEEAPNVSHACKETSQNAFNSFFGICNDNISEDQSDATEESLPNTRLRKRRAAKTRLQKKRSYCGSTSGESDLEGKPSSYYLNEYNDDFLIKFIECLRQNECLWNANCVMYRNRVLKEKAYEKLMQIYLKMLPHQPKPDVDTIKSMLRRLKYYYKRCQNGTPNRPMARHYIWQLMAFIEGGRPSKDNQRNFVGNGDSVSTGSYDCSKCSKKFKRIRFYNCHMLSKHPPTECPKCSEDFDNADDLKTHLLWYHRKDDECPICNTKSLDGAGDWKSNIHMAEHFYEHHCDDCDRIFYDYGNYNKHRTQCRQKNKEFTCTQCKAVFSNHNKLWRHTLQNHAYSTRSTNKQRSKQTKAKPKKRSCYCR